MYMLISATKNAAPYVYVYVYVRTCCTQRESAASCSVLAPASPEGTAAFSVTDSPMPTDSYICKWLMIVIASACGLCLNEDLI